MNLLRFAEQARGQPVVERPQLLEIVLQRCPGQRQTLAGANLPDAFRDGRSRIFHRLRLVQHRDVVVVPEQRFMVPVEQRIGRDDQVIVGNVRKTPPPVGPVQHQNLQLRHEARGLAPPVADQARRHHKEAREVDLLLQMPVRQQREGLHGLAEPHVVGQHAAEPAIRERPQPAVAGALVGPQSSLQRSGRRQFRGLGERPEPGAQIEHLPPAGPGHAAAFEGLRQLEQAPRIGPMELEQPLRFQKRFGEAPRSAKRPVRARSRPRAARRIACRPGGSRYRTPSSSRPHSSTGSSATSWSTIGTTSNVLPFASSDRLSENQSVSVDSSAVENGDRTVVQPERPGLVDLDAPALGPQAAEPPV